MAINPNHSVSPAGDANSFSCPLPEEASDLELARRLSATVVVIGKLAKRSQDRTLTRIFEKLTELDNSRLVLLSQFLEQIVEIHDPDAVSTFLRWKEDPVLDTILQLAAQLDEDARYEIVDLAEQLAN